MKSRDFCYWLQGFFELENFTSNHPDKINITEKQAQCIKNHLAMVFRHEIDPSFGKDLPDLTKIHASHDGRILDSTVAINC